MKAHESGQNLPFTGKVLKIFQSRENTFALDLARFTFSCTIFLQVREREKIKLQENRDFGPKQLFDMVIDRLGLKSDRALTRLIDISPSIISKMRSETTPMSDYVLLCLHEETDIPIRELKSYLKPGQLQTSYRYAPRRHSQISKSI